METYLGVQECQNYVDFQIPVVNLINSLRPWIDYWDYSNQYDIVIYYHSKFHVFYAGKTF